MPRLLIAVDSLRTGIGIVAWNLANNLGNKYDVHIITNEKNLLEPKRKLYVYVVPTGRYPFRTISYATALRPRMSSIVRQISPDIIHSLCVMPWFYIFGSDRRNKMVITPTGSDVYPRSRNPVYNLLIDHALGASPRIVCNSHWLSKYVNEKYHVGSVAIPTGVDTQVFRPTGHSARNKVILFVGRLIEKKGVLDLVEAARALPEYEFWLAGEGPLKIPTLQNVKTLGFQSNIAKLYANAALCVFPAHYENFPNTGLEAMACGRTLVATKRGFSEYVEDGRDGLLVNAHDVPSLVCSIKFLMNNHKVRRRLERNAQRKAAQYDWSLIAKRYEAFYETL